jgi:hypothetical protein
MKQINSLHSNSPWRQQQQRVAQMQIRAKYKYINSMDTGRLGCLVANREHSQVSRAPYGTAASDRRLASFWAAFKAFPCRLDKPRTYKVFRDWRIGNGDRTFGDTVNEVLRKVITARTFKLCGLKTVLGWHANSVSPE